MTKSTRAKRCWQIIPSIMKTNAKDMVQKIEFFYQGNQWKPIFEMEIAPSLMLTS